MLLKAADVQEANGLHQHGWYDHAQQALDTPDPRKSRVCALGAININDSTGPPTRTDHYETRSDGLQVSAVHTFNQGSPLP
ncbi:DUF6197 family protein [Nonomuraea sp. CA-141351]|uniref:DUF6197 family protein n=1 Tax=Nonomuraea sp. CA-141351 TaxID=3239996 RepID=UPI003D8B129B